MARICTVCSHPRRDEIERAIVEGTPIRRIAADTGLSETALHRHKKAGHISAKIAAFQGERERVTVQELNQIAHDGLTVLVDLIKRARDREDDRLVVQALRELREYVRFMNEVVIGPETSAPSFRDSPEWVAVRVALIEAVGDNPALRPRLIEVLEDGEDGDGVEA